MPGTVRRTSTGWIADVTLNGVRRVGRATTKTEAMARKRELLEELMAPRASGARAGTPGFTMRDAFNLSATIRWAGTKGERTSIINARMVMEAFGPDTQLASITAARVDLWRQQLLRQGARPATVNRKVSALRGMLSDAVLHGHIHAAPQMPRQLRADNHRDRVLLDHERDAICRWLTEAGEPAAADLIVFLLETAARWGDAERLKGGDVDLGRGRATFWETKTGKPRTVPLTRRAQDAIRPHLPAVRSHRVWPYQYHTMRRLLQRALDHTGLGEEPIGLHTLRHTCASKLASAGVSLAQLQAFGGWTSLAACQRYLHLSTGALDACVEALQRE